MANRIEYKWNNIRLNFMGQEISKLVYVLETGEEIVVHNNPKQEGFDLKMKKKNIDKE